MTQETGDLEVISSVGTSTTGKIADSSSMEVDEVQVPVSAVTNSTAATDHDVSKDVRRRLKSGRWWKSVRKERSSAVVKVKPLKSSWERKMKAKADLENVKKVQQEVRDKLAAKKAAKIEARKERERRREENARKAEIVQVIKNTAKLKKAKKKQLRKIEKRDTN